MKKNTAPVLKPARVQRVSEGTQARIKALQNMAAELLTEIGRIEVRKSSVLAEISKLNAEGAAILAKEAKVLGIPEGKSWKFSADGTVEVSE